MRTQTRSRFIPGLNQRPPPLVYSSSRADFPRIFHRDTYLAETRFGIVGQETYRRAPTANFLRIFSDTDTPNLKPNRAETAEGNASNPGENIPARDNNSAAWLAGSNVYYNYTVPRYLDNNVVTYATLHKFSQSHPA